MQRGLRELKTKPYQCGKCDKAFTSLMRLQHHIATEHAIRTSRDIVTTHDIRHQPKKAIPAAGLVHST